MKTTVILLLPNAFKNGWQLPEPVFVSSSWMCSGLIPQCGSVCSLHDLLTYGRERGWLFIPKMRPQGVLQCISGGGWNYMHLLISPPPPVCENQGMLIKETLIIFSNTSNFFHSFSLVDGFYCSCELRAGICLTIPVRQSPTTDSEEILRLASTWANSNCTLFLKDRKMNVWASR